MSINLTVSASPLPAVTYVLPYAHTFYSATPFVCPVCSGRGTVSPDFYPDRRPEESSRPPCRSCAGTGIVWYHAVVNPKQEVTYGRISNYEY